MNYNINIKYYIVPSVNWRYYDRILDQHRSGMFERARKQIRASKRQPCTNPEDSHDHSEQIKKENLFLAFGLLLLGYVASLTAFVLEHLSAYYHNNHLATSRSGTVTFTTIRPFS